MNKNFLIIGASAAGLGAAVKLRDLNKTINITCITAEQEMPYNRCLLADFLAGSKTAEQVATKPQEYFDTNNITLLRGTKVTRIEPTLNRITLESGNHLDYDYLFIGTGRTSPRLPIPGNKLENVFSFYDLQDTKALAACIKQINPKRATVIGAGLSGLECADALTEYNLQIDVIERGNQVLGQQIDQEGSNLLQSLMAKFNVTLHNNCTVEKITGDTAVTGVTLSTGHELPSDLVIFATGGTLSTPLARDAGITCTESGILTNEFMQTSIPNIFAGGDVCLVRDQLSGELIQSCLWTDAILQGMAAAHGMLGTPKKYAGALIVTSSNIFGIKFVTCGPVNNPPENYVSHIKRTHDSYHKFVTLDGKLKGFVMIGNVDNVGSLRKKLLDETPFILDSIG